MRIEKVNDFPQKKNKTKSIFTNEFYSFLLGRERNWGAQLLTINAVTNHNHRFHFAEASLSLLAFN